MAIAQVLGYLTRPSDPNLLVGTETHDDAGVYQLTPDLAIVQTVDFFPPVVDDPFIYGQIAAANALSDVYAMGGKPVTALNLVGYPDDKLEMDWLGRILQGGAERCAAAGCTVLGGHTVRDAEIKFGLAVTGTIHPNRIFTNATAKPGDVLILTKPLGTGFVTTAAKRNICPPDVLAAACSSMVELNKAAAEAVLEVGANAITDITGFGLAGHGLELADGSQVTLELSLSALPLIAGIETIDVSQCQTRGSKSNRDYTTSSIALPAAADPFRVEFLFDPQTSGGLLISVPAERAEVLLRRLREVGTPAAAVIGEVRPRGKNSIVVRN